MSTKHELTQEQQAALDTAVATEMAFRALPRECADRRYRAAYLAVERSLYALGKAVRDRAAQSLVDAACPPREDGGR